MKRTRESVQKFLRIIGEKGGLSFRESFDDIILDENSNEIISEFIRKKIYEIVEDAETAKSLSPVDHPFGTRATHRHKLF